MSVAKGRAEGIVPLKVPARDGDAGELLQAIATVLIAEDVFFPDILRTGRMLA